MVDDKKDEEVKDSAVAKDDVDAAASTDAVSKEDTSAKEESATTTESKKLDEKDSNKEKIKEETKEEPADGSAAQESKDDQGDKGATKDAAQSVETTSGQTDSVKPTADEAKVDEAKVDEAKAPSAPMGGIPVPALPNVPNAAAMQTKTEPAEFPGAPAPLDLGDVTGGDVKVPDLNAPGSLEIDKNVSEGELGPVVSAAGKNGKAFFPMKLYDIVSDEKNEDIIKWLPGGKAFIIVDKKRFANEVLPQHFQQSQFTSFTRKLSRWRFTRVPRGPFIGAYYNKLFLKGHRSLCWHMRCKNENLGKMKFDRKMTDPLKEIPGAMDPNAAARGGPGGMMMPQQGHPGAMMPVPGQMAIQGFQMPPMGGVPAHLAHTMPGHPQNLQPGVNPGLNNQILAIEGRLRELRSAEQAAFMYDQQKMMAGHVNPTMDDIYANRARMMGMAPGMNNMVDYGNPHFMGGSGAAQGVPGAPPGSQPLPQAQPPVPQQMPGAPVGGPPPQLPPEQMQPHHEAPVGAAPPSAGAPIQPHF